MKCSWCGMNVPEEDIPEHLDQHVEDMRGYDPNKDADEQEVPFEEDYERGSNGLG